MSKVCVNEQPCDCPKYHPPGGKPQQWVVCAANMDQYGTIICGARHFDAVMRDIIDKTPGTDVYSMKQGFIDQFGNFLTREAAWVLAVANNQIRRLNVADGRTGKLYSEHLY